MIKRPLLDEGSSLASRIPDLQAWTLAFTATKAEAFAEQRELQTLLTADMEKKSLKKQFLSL
jgi:hypothetical protein